ncbi:MULTISPECIES: aldo/keto reductase [Mesonia]|uniref:General stress protein 69 n=1 Tax=Mesonia oceanica TaxID=2687242 RepID=A0AC61Y5Q6_9FLAO|nr:MULTISPECIES: aldo/keto reductase [Mesonia]MAN26207.1 aldo/keto reductase [Mesonia sp.]MAQ42639.1 aldo/keto reductase [Mesonia sp.]MBJ99177.1 aldo/keto reductase [Flavobacteriaceae bacterium]VVU99823.1 General stress protein 69 [Mesonia oceanica]|tara:strand:+ start:2908 stop:3927 length:1020 start_codon:yes stop_codon:yes gene_type:complete
MKYNLLGKTGLWVSEICLGTMTFGAKGRFAAVGGVDQEGADALVRQALDAGVNFIDTANVYSEGISEEMTGEALKNLGVHRDDIILATKVRGKMGEKPNQKGLSRKHIINQVEASLKRLGTDYIDLYQIHSNDPITPIDETLRALDDLVRTGKVRYIGASNVAAWQLMKALDYSYYNHLERFNSLQAYYTLAGRDLEREIIPLLKDQQVGLMVWSPLAGGLLSGKYDRDGDRKTGGRRDDFDFPPVNREKAFNIIDVLRPMAKENGVSIAQLAIAWLLKQEAVSTVIVGAKKQSQLEENLNASIIEFSKDDLEKLEKVSKLEREYPGWMLDLTKQDREL